MDITKRPTYESSTDFQSDLEPNSSSHFLSSSSPEHNPLSHHHLPSHETMYSTSKSSYSPRKAFTILGITILTISTLVFLWTSHPPSTFTLRSSTARTVTTKFTHHEEYMDLSPKGDANWTKLLPPNGGFLSQGIADGGYEMAGITMFHQLHCLQMIRTAVQELMESQKELENEIDIVEDEKGDMGKEHGVKRKIWKRHGPQMDQEHWVHCLDYLMQGVLCAADDTIEFAHDIEDGGRVVDGYEVVHKCRNPDAVWAKIMGPKSTPGWKVNPELKGRKPGASKKAGT